MTRLGMRRLVCGLVVLAAVLGASAPSGAGLVGVSFTISKVVEGTAPAGFVVEISCTDPSIGILAGTTLAFEADGTPTAVGSTPGPFAISGGSWVAALPIPPADSDCVVAETQTAGGTTSFSCSFTGVGACLVAGGSGAEVTVLFADDGNANAVVTFTNAFTNAVPTTDPATVAPIVSSPQLTG